MLIFFLRLFVLQPVWTYISEKDPPNSFQDTPTSICMITVAASSALSFSKPHVNLTLCPSLSCSCTLTFSFLFCLFCCFLALFLVQQLITASLLWALGETATTGTLRPPTPKWWFSLQSAIRQFGVWEQAVRTLSPLFPLFFALFSFSPSFQSQVVWLLLWYKASTATTLTWLLLATFSTLTMTLLVLAFLPTKSHVRTTTAATTVTTVTWHLLWLWLTAKWSIVSKKRKDRNRQR